jgi:hypothetical protein
MCPTRSLLLLATPIPSTLVTPPSTHPSTATARTPTSASASSKRDPSTSPSAPLLALLKPTMLALTPHPTVLPSRPASTTTLTCCSRTERLLVNTVLFTTTAGLRSTLPTLASTVVLTSTPLSGRTFLPTLPILLLLASPSRERWMDFEMNLWPFCVFLR